MKCFSTENIFPYRFKLSPGTCLSPAPRNVNTTESISIIEILKEKHVYMYIKTSSHTWNIFDRSANLLSTYNQMQARKCIIKKRINM